MFSNRFDTYRSCYWFVVIDSQINRSTIDDDDDMRLTEVVTLKRYDLVKLAPSDVIE